MNPFATNLLIPVTPFPNDAHPNNLYKTIVKEKYLVKNRIEVPVEDLNPELNKWLAKYNMEIYMAELFSKLPNPARWSNRIHSGGLSSDRTKINWVWGGKHSSMTWYEKKRSYQPNSVPNSNPSHITYYEDLELSNAEPLHRHQLIYPTATLVQIAVPHAVENPEECRWCLATLARDITTKEGLTYAETCHRLHDVVEKL